MVHHDFGFTWGNVLALKTPNFRFGTGFIFGLLFACFSFISIVLINKINWGVFSKIASLVIIGVFIVFAFDTVKIDALADRIISPADYRIYPSEPCRMGNFQMFCAKFYMECWYRPFPCVPFGKLSVFMRGDTFQEGFRKILSTQ